MNWRKIIIGIIFILAIISVFIIRNISQADAAVNLGADIETIRDDDGSIYHIYNVYFTISANEEINHIEGTYEEIGLNVLEIESSGNFYAEYIDMDEKSFSFISNDVYTSSDGKVYFARVVSQYADPDYTEDCTLKFNALRDLVSTNDVDITKSAITSTDSLVNLDNVEFNEEFYYKITIQNTSPIPTDTINFIDQIPSELEVLDVDFNDILGNRSGNTITYTLDSLGVGEGKTIYIKVRLIDATGNTILNTASITVGDKEKSDDYVIGEITNHTAKNWFNIVEISKGYNDGIKKDDAVINSEGLVGFVSKVSGKMSEVKLLTSVSQNNMLSVTIETNDGYVAGVLSDYDVNTGLFKVDGVMSKSNILAGDKVTLSGYDNESYKGIYVGMVVKEESSNYGLNKTIWVESSVNFDDLMFVAVVKEKK